MLYTILYYTILYSTLESLEPYCTNPLRGQLSSGRFAYCNKEADLSGGGPS